MYDQILQIVWKDYTGYVSYHNDIKRFDFKVIELLSPNLFTVLPISSKESRAKADRRFPDRVRVDCVIDSKYHHFKITDDWGDIHKLSIPHRFGYEIKQAIGLANIKHNIPFFIKDIRHDKA